MAEKKSHVRIEDGMAVICIPADEIYDLLVALHPCPCADAVMREAADVRGHLVNVLKLARSRL